MPGYLQNGSTFAAKSSGIRKILTKKLDCQLDYVDPYHSIESWREFSFPIAANEEESDKTWASIVEKGIMFAGLNTKHQASILVWMSR